MRDFLKSQKGLWLAAASLGVVSLFSVGGLNAGERITYEPPLPPYSSSNLFANAKVSASGHWRNQKPELAVDGRINLDSYWGCENLPVHLTVDMEKANEISAVRLWLYWGGDRVYKYYVEGSANGSAW